MANPGPEVKISTDWTGHLRLYRSSVPKQLLTGLAVCVIYILDPKLRLRLASVHPRAPPLWPPTGIAIAARLPLGTGFWPVVFAGAFLVNFTTVGTALTSVGGACGNT